MDGWMDDVRHIPCCLLTVLVIDYLEYHVISSLKPDLD